MPEDGNPVSLYARLTITILQMSTNVKDPEVVRYTRGKLLNMSLLSALLKSREGNMRALRVDASKRRLDLEYLKRDISDRSQFLERAKKRPEAQKHDDEAHII